MSFVIDNDKTNFIKKFDILKLFKELKTSFGCDELKRLPHTFDGKIVDYFVTNCDRFARFDRFEFIRTMDINNQKLEISKIIIRSESQHYIVYKFDSKDKIAYYAIDKNEFIGSGSDGSVYAGFNILTGEPLVAKFGHIGIYEEEFLKKTGLYIASEKSLVPSTVLMHRAPGKSYDHVLRDPMPDSKKIEIHEKIIEKFLELRDIHNISHNDVSLRHIFVNVADNNRVTIIDFGLSNQSSPGDMADISRLHQRTREISDTCCGGTFNDYIDRTINHIEWNETIDWQKKKDQEEKRKIREENINRFIGMCLVIIGIGTLIASLVKIISNKSQFK